jgi:hypothetical protein
MLNGIDDRYEKTTGYPYPVVFLCLFFGREDVMRHWPKEKAILD